MSKRLISVLVYAGLALAGLLLGMWLTRGGGDAAERFRGAPAFPYTHDLTVSWWACPPETGETLLVIMPMQLRYGVDPANVAPGATGLTLAANAVGHQPSRIPTNFRDLLADLRLDTDQAPTIQAEVNRAEAIATFLAGDLLRWSDSPVREGIGRQLRVLWRTASGEKGVAGTRLTVDWPDYPAAKTDAKTPGAPPFGIPVCAGHGLLTVNGNTYLMTGGRLLRTDSSAGAAARFAGVAPAMLASDAAKKPELLQATQLQQGAVAALQKVQGRFDAIRTERRQLDEEMLELQKQHEALQEVEQAALASDAAPEAIEDNRRQQSDISERMTLAQDRLDRLAEQELDLDPEHMAAEAQVRTAEMYRNAVVQSLLGGIVTEPAQADDEPAEPVAPTRTLIVVEGRL